MDHRLLFRKTNTGSFFSALDLNVGYITAPPGVYFGGDLTITAWILLRSVTSWARILDFGNGPKKNNIILSYSNGFKKIK